MKGMKLSTVNSRLAQRCSSVSSNLKMGAMKKIGKVKQTGLKIPKK